MNLSNLPAGSAIHAETTFDGVTLEWKKPTGGPVRFLIAGFLIFWLFGWAAGFSSALKSLLSGSGASAFLVVWLCGWTLGGLFAAYMAWALIRPQRAESIVLTRDTFRYDAGSPALDFTSRRRAAQQNDSKKLLSSILAKGAPIEISRTDCPPFVLEGEGESHRIYFHLGNKRHVVGTTLDSAEREWLAEVLESWRKS